MTYRIGSTLSLAVILFACGDVGGSTSTTGAATDPTPTASGTYAAKCKVGCTPKQTSDCADEDTTSCEADCVVRTEGLSILCAQCIVEHTRWFGGARGCSYNIGSASHESCLTTCK